MVQADGDHGDAAAGSGAGAIREIAVETAAADVAAPLRGGARKPIVIVGSGFAGAYCAQRLEKLLGEESSRVMLVDQQNYFVFYPLLIEAGTGALEPRHAVVSIRSFLKRARFVMARVVEADFTRNRVRYDVAGGAMEWVEYEHLVIALGSVTLLPDIAGLREYAFEMKSLADAVGLRDRAIQLLERAEACADPAERRRMLRFVVVGANFTGSELAGEFQVFLRSAAKLYPRVAAEECRVTLVERAERILGALPADLSEYAAKKMRDRGIEVVTNTSVTSVAADHVVLSDGRTIPTRTTIWCAGIAPPPVVADLELPTDARGYILCERDLRVRGMGNVWAIGDAAVNTDAAGKAYPATAQHAIREGFHAARNIVATLRGTPVTPFDYAAQGYLAALGCRTGVAKVGPFKISGVPAWFLWRTVYLMKMPGLGRKLRVALDWTLDWFFPRDYVQLGVHRRAGRAGKNSGGETEKASLWDGR
jgi:NADH dehydrogenase